MVRLKQKSFRLLLRLTLREAEVLRWVAIGKTNAEVGNILGLSARTVQKHLEHTFQKLGVENRTAAAARAHDMLSRFDIRGRMSGVVS